MGMNPHFKIMVYSMKKLSRQLAIALLDAYYKDQNRKITPKYQEYTLQELKKNLQMFDIKLKSS